MTNVCDCSVSLDDIIAEWEGTRMYPPNYRKETAMKKPEHKHINAITRAQHLLETGVDVTNKPVLANSIEKDIALLCEVRDMLYNIIENPPLPFADVYDDEKKPLLNSIEDEPDEAD